MNLPELSTLRVRGAAATHKHRADIKRLMLRRGRQAGPGGIDMGLSQVVTAVIDDLRPPGTRDLSAAGLPPLLNLTFERHRFGVSVMPVVAVPLVWFFSRTQDATGLALWGDFFLVFALGLQWAISRHAQDMQSLDAPQIVRRWQPRFEHIGLLLRVHAPRRDDGVWADPNRRHAAAASYAVQAVGTLVLWAAGADGVGLWVAGMVLFGLGIGNATSLPPLIAQAEFVPRDVPRVVARSVAMAQALYAFAPAVLAGLIVRDSAGLPPLGTTTGVYFFVVFVLQVLAAGCVLSVGRAVQSSLVECR